MNVIDARDIFSKKKNKQKDIEDKKSITIEKLRLYLHREDFTEHQIDIVVDLYKLFTMK